MVQLAGKMSVKQAKHLDFLSTAFSVVAVKLLLLMRSAITFVQLRKTGKLKAWKLASYPTSSIGLTP
jgi:hypothetical protein